MSGFERIGGFSDEGGNVPDYGFVPYKSPPPPKQKKKKKDFAKRKRHNLPARNAYSAEHAPRYNFKGSHHKRPYRKRRISEIQRDSKYQRKLAARRGHYGKRVRKLLYASGKLPRSAGMVGAHYRKMGSKNVLIRAHGRHPRNYAKKKAKRLALRDPRRKSI